MNLSWHSRLAVWRGCSALRSWLLEGGSLTARLQRNARHFRVRLASHGPGRPLADEGGGRCALVREVVLEADGVPVIFAHTILPLAPRGRLTAWLARLGTRSLGSLLFSHPGFRRAPIEYCSLNAGHPLYRRAAAACGDLPAQLWARRSWHRLGGQRVLVTEVFLPEISRLTRP